MRWSLYLFACIAGLGRWGCAQESGWGPGQVNTTMCQWTEPRVGVIRDTVYIDGGYLWWWPGLADGTYGSPIADGNPLGIVYLFNFSLPFNISSNMTQIFTTISKAPNGGAANNFGPQYYDGAMFANDDEYYTYGGLVANTAAFSPPDSQSVEGYEAFWYGAAGKQFTPGFIEESLPSGLTRYVTAGGGVSVPSENKGFYFSGLRSASSGLIFLPSSNESVNADVVSNTLISLDMSAQRSEKWTNQTLPTSVPGRANPELVWVPVSANGVLIAIGGSVDPEFAYISESLNNSQATHDQSANPGLMTTVSVYDVNTGAWYNQPTTGTAPGGLTQGCTVVASAQDDSSHNIYWYGGFDGIDSSKAFSDDVWVLSVPSFTWTKVYSGNNTHGRAGHKCVKPYPDQMFVIGGYPGGETFSCVENGIVQVFNLSSATWMTSYDPAVWSNYSVPSTIYSTIGGNGAGGATKTPSSWANQSLATVFSTPYDATKITKWYPYASQAATPTNPRITTSATPSPSSSGGGLPSWVAPVLGVVLGLVALSAILVFILLWRRRRLFRQQGGSVTDTSDMHRNRIMSWVRGAGAEPKAPTVTSDETPSSPYDDSESPGDPNHVMPAEAAGEQVHEMADTSQPQELSDTGLRYIPAVTALRPSYQGHASHDSQSSDISQRSNDSVSSRGAVSPALSSSTPRADSPSLGNDSRARFVSGVSATSSDYRALAGDVPSGSGAGIQPVLPPAEEVAESPKGSAVMSPISPPTPHGKDGSEYLSSPSSQSSQSPQSPQNAQRKGKFGEML